MYSMYTNMQCSDEDGLQLMLCAKYTHTRVYVCINIYIHIYYIYEYKSNVYIICIYCIGHCGFVCRELRLCKVKVGVLFLESFSFHGRSCMEIHGSITNKNTGTSVVTKLSIHWFWAFGRLWLEI